MGWLISVFNKSFVYRFYEAHLLVFLFFALVIFGVADGRTVLYLHYYILQSAFSSPFILLCLWLVWLLYAANALRFMLSTLSEDQFQFLYVSNAANSFNLFNAINLAVVQVNAPVLIYGVAGVVIAISKGFYLNSLIGVFGLAFIIFTSSAIIYYRLINTHKNTLLAGIKIFPTVHFRPGTVSILLRHVTHQNKAAFIATKLFSCAVIYGAHYEWASFNYDIRWMQVAMAISIPAQGMLIYQLWDFETTYLSFTRNFPIDLWKRYLQVLYIMLILLIPEGMLLASYCMRFHILWQLPVYFLYAAFLPMLLYAMLFTHGFNQESFNGFLFAIGLTTFFVTLFGFTWLLALAFLPLSLMVYSESYYKFEKS